MTAAPQKRWIFAVTGASGAPYAQRLIACALDAGVQVHLVVSPHGRQLFRDEMGLRQITPRSLLGRDDDRLIIANYRDVGAAIASGSTPIDGMIICPCSSNTLAQVAAGFGDNLVNRAAQVTLKERRRLILVPREMPMSHLEIENCLRLSAAGAIICPASPGFYMRPQRVADLVDFVVGKLLDLAGIPHPLHTRWTDMLTQTPAEAEDAP
jgi:flavin prenyltransferase